jgi:NAD-dependent SIR2 family protein deacetylase
MMTRPDAADLCCLARWVCEAKTVVWFTGAGISTESGLPDYRGPDGVWTRREKGLPDPVPDLPFEQAEPNTAHLAIVEFEKMGKCDFLITQNVDDLHRKSGFPTEKLVELHGNRRRLRCRSCRMTYPLADFRTDTGQRRTYKGRVLADKCPDCNGPLESSVINFGETLPGRELSDAFNWARRADLLIVVGSSCRVTPAADVPRMAARHGARVVIVNIGQTAIDDDCDLRFDDKAGRILPRLLDMVQASQRR